MTAVSASRSAPTVTVRVIDAADGALLIGVVANDATHARGGIIKLTAPAYEEFVRVMAERAARKAA